MTENSQPKPASKLDKIQNSETLLEQLHMLDEYLLERSNSVGNHSDGAKAAMAYENSSRLLRNILKDQKEPETEWGVQYLTERGEYDYWWGFSADPRLQRRDKGLEIPSVIDEYGCISLDDEFVEVTAVAKRIKPILVSEWEFIEKASGNTAKTVQEGPTE